MDLTWKAQGGGVSDETDQDRGRCLPSYLRKDKDGPLEGQTSECATDHSQVQRERRNMKRHPSRRPVTPLFPSLLSAHTVSEEMRHRKRPTMTGKTESEVPQLKNSRVQQNTTIPASDGRDGGRKIIAPPPICLPMQPKKPTSIKDCSTDTSWRNPRTQD
jgi:hypothetical protein